MPVPNFNKQKKYWVSNATVFFVSDVFKEEEVEEICEKIEKGMCQFPSSSSLSLCQVLLRGKPLFISVGIGRVMTELPREDPYTRAPEFVTEVIRVDLPMDEHLQLVETSNRDFLPAKYLKLEVIEL